jgi:hypothetical protein
MIPGSGSGEGPRQVSRRAAHSKPHKRSAVARVIAAGGAVICIGAAYEITAPTVHALSIVFRTPDGSGHTNEMRVNVLQGNIFDPQLGILGANVSNNSTTGSGASSTPNNPLVNNPLFNNPVTRLINAVLNAEFVIGGAASGPINNSMQISFGSFNIFNPQSSIFGGNLSNNTAGANLAVGNGNNTSASATSVPNFWNSFLGGMTGNGNVMQFAFFSGNIFNPQWSIFGPNVSNNTAETNVAANNGNYSQANGAGGGLLGAVARLFLGGMTGNGNTTQVAVGTSNVTNPQVSIGGSNQSNNTAVTNDAAGNGNNSQTSTGGLSTGTTGNGNTNQTAIGSSNIENTQVSVGDVGITPRPEELSASHSNSQPTSASTTPTSTAAKATETSSSSSVATTGTTGTSGSSATESTSSATGSAGAAGTAGASGAGGAAGTGSGSGSGGSEGAGGSGGE